MVLGPLWSQAIFGIFRSVVLEKITMERRLVIGILTVLLLASGILAWITHLESHDHLSGTSLHETSGASVATQPRRHSAESSQYNAKKAPLSGSNMRGKIQIKYGDPLKTGTPLWFAHINGQTRAKVIVEEGGLFSLSLPDSFRAQSFRLKTAKYVSASINLRKRGNPFPSDLGVVELFPKEQIPVLVLHQKRPLKGADVSLFAIDSDKPIGHVQSNKPLVTLRSDQRGRCVFDDVAPGSYFLRALAPRLKGRFSRDLLAFVGTAIDTVTLELNPLREIRGIVVDGNGEPIANATLTPRLHRSFGNAVFIEGEEIVTNDRGCFTFSSSEGEPQVLTVSHPGYLSQVVCPAEGKEQFLSFLRITLNRGCTVRGLVVRQDTLAPISGALVSIDTFQGNRHRETRTNGVGIFELQHVDPKDIDAILVSVLGFKTENEVDGGEPVFNWLLGTDDSYAEGALIEKTYRMIPAASISRGTVTGQIADFESGLGIPGVSVSIRERGAFTHDDSLCSLTDSQGRYRIAGALAGNVEVFAAKEGFYQPLDEPHAARPYSSPLSTLPVSTWLFAGSELKYPDIQLIKGILQEGHTLTPEGRPLGGVQIRCWATNASGRRSFVEAVTSDESGNFEIKKIPRSSDIYLVACHPHFAGSAVASYTADKIGKVAISMRLNRGAHIVGTVAGPNGFWCHTPVFLRSVRMPGGSLDFSLRQEDRMALTDKLGRFSFTGVPLGTFQIATESQDGYSARDGVSKWIWNPDGAKQEVNFTFYHEGTMAGLVVDRDGLPLAKALVQLVPGDENKDKDVLFGRWRVMTDAQGYFRIKNVHLGRRYRLTAVFYDTAIYDFALESLEEATTWGPSVALTGVVGGEQDLRVVIDTRTQKK